MAATLLEQVSADLDTKYDLVFGFAEIVTGPEGELRAIFSNEYIEADGGGFVGASSSVPTLRVRDADALAKGDSVTVRAVEYHVVEIRPNGYGETFLRLQKA